ncbi:MAG TPA: hypothetical protein VFA18_07750 [Gemmataceae bacterium]|nr:hypothetical protein [Gemmataceae bacterium]
MDSEQKLVEALRAIEVQMAGLPAGDAAQAERARMRIIERCRELATAGDVAEFQYSLPDQWSQVLFHALLKRYGLVGYRYKWQRHSTVMVRASKRLVDEVLDPLLKAMSQRLNEHFDAVAEMALSAALSPGPYTVQIRPDHDHASGQLCPECAKKVSG